MRRTPAPLPDRNLRPPLLGERWRLVRTLETSGSGALFLAWDEAHRLWCAVEIAREESGVRRLQREHAALRELDHPNVDTVAVLGVEGPVVYAPRRYLRDPAPRFAPMLPGHALRLALEVADALVHAHGRGRVHGRLCPERVRIDVDGRVVVAGWADHREPIPMDPRFAHLAPEVRECGTPDERSDVYGLGSLLGALATGPEGTPPGIRSLMVTACAQDPAARPKTMAELRDGIARRLAVEEAPTRTPWGPKLMPPGPPPIVDLDAPLSGLARLLCHPTARGERRRDVRLPSAEVGSGSLDPTTPRPARARGAPAADRSASSLSGGSVRTRTLPAAAPPSEPQPSRREGLLSLLVAGLVGLVTAVVGAVPVAAFWARPAPPVRDAAGAAFVAAVVAEQWSIAPLAASAADPEPLERAWFTFDDLRTPEAAAEVSRQAAALDDERLAPELRAAIGRLREAELRWSAWSVPGGAARRP